MTIRNFTPHAINIVLADDSTREFLSEGIARCTTTAQQCGEVGGIPIYRTVFGAVEGLPPENDTDTFIVSFPVLQALPQRRDLVGPDTSPAGNPIRNEAGQISAVRRFQKV